MIPRASTVFIVDDDLFQVFYLSSILALANHRIETFVQPEELLARLTPGDRGCVVLDLQMPGLNGLELQRALADRGVALPLLFVSGQASVPAVVTAMKLGALDFLSKPVDPDALLKGVEVALQKDAEGASWRAARDRARERWTVLSAREQEVSRLFARGLINKQIAAEMGVTESTVKTQRARALQKLAMSTVRELVDFFTLMGAEH